MGIRVSDFLVDVDFCFADLDFSKILEDNLDRIANKEIEKIDILNHFWDRLKSDIEKAKEKREESARTDHKCKKCEGFLELKHSKFGPFYSCSNRTSKEKKCDYKCDVGENGIPKEKEKKEVEINESTFDCENCGEKLIIKINKRGGEMLACRNFAKDKKCSGFFKADTGEKIVFKKKKYKKWKK